MRWLVFVLCLFIITNCSSKLPTVIKEPQEICVDYEPIDTFVNWSINAKPQSEWTDVDWLAKMMMSEINDSLDIEGLYLVAITAVNHTKMFDRSLVEALTYPNIFCAVNNNSCYYWRAEPTTVHKRLAIIALSQEVPKELSNLFAFCAYDQISNSAKSWFSQFKVYKKIKTVSFYMNEKV
jgi:hypothetical protein